MERETNTRTMDRKLHGSESSLYGLFAPGNESAEEHNGYSNDSSTVNS